MATEWIDIVDTAVKIGLGALISGVATYIVSNLSHKKEIEKNLATKRINIVEEIAELAEEYFWFFTELNNLVAGLAKGADNAGEKLTAKQWAYIEPINRGVNEAISNRNKALSKIKLLSIPNAEAELWAFNVILADFRQIIIVDRTLITEDKQNELYERAREHKDNFYAAVSNFLSSTGT
jgi:hypothetical protein